MAEHTQIDECISRLCLQLDALQIKVDSMSAKVDFLFNKDIGNHCIWEIVDNKVVIKGVRNLKQEMRDASRLACSKVLEAAGLS